VPSGGCCRLLGQASGEFRGEARTEDFQSPSRASVHIPEGLVRHALPLTDDGSISLRRLRPLCAEAGEFELVTILYVLCPKNFLSSSNYLLDRCFPEISGTSYGDKFADLAGPDDFTRPPSGVFWWLINVRPGYLVFWQGDSCTIEPYMLSRFARQFGYDQLYVGNLNTRLCFSGNLFEGAWA